MNRLLSGIIAPITTPFTDEQVNLEFLRENVEKYAKTGLAGYLVLGSNGENKSLDEQEKRLVLQTVIQGKSESQFVIAGIAAESTWLSVEQSKLAAEMGADYVSLLTPSYFKGRLTDQALVRYYSDVADKSPCPVLLYNAPKFTGMDLSAHILEEVSKHPNIAGIKDTSPANYMRYLMVCPQEFKVFAGSMETLLPALTMGAAGGVVSLADAFPTVCCSFYDLVQDGKTAEAQAQFRVLFRLNQSVSGSYAVAGVKFAMDLAGYHGGNPRLPLLPLKPEDKEAIKDSIRKAGICLEQIR